jgi:quercetin dioxygenase-like cupin family protein
MKTVKILLPFAMMFLVISAYAQDPLTVAPNIYKKVLFENESVRVLEVEMKPGEGSAVHSHPKHLAYVVQGGQITFDGPDGKPQVAELKAGEVMWMDAITHSGKNTGKTVIKGIITELKQ